MGARFFSLLAVLFLVAACSSTPKDVGSVTTNSDMIESDKAPITDIGAVDQSMLGAGSQEDLVKNVGDRIFFGYDQYDLNGESKATIEQQAQWLKTYPSVSIMIEGHCDERGTREYNLALGEKRANAVRNYLIANGIDASRIQTISYGKERPAVTGSDEISWAQNRRGVVVVQ